jgi:F-type H+-transporting ATPase subunit b
MRASPRDWPRHNADNRISRTPSRKSIVDEAKDAARDEADKIKVAATADIDQQVNSAREHLRKEVSSIALAGAEQILKREVDAKAHAAVLDELVAQI